MTAAAATAMKKPNWMFIVVVGQSWVGVFDLAKRGMTLKRQHSRLKGTARSDDRMETRIQSDIGRENCHI